MPPGQPSIYGRIPRTDPMTDSGVSVYDLDDPDRYELLAWVKASDRREDILTTLEQAPKNTNDFADRWGVELETVRYHLTHLQEGGPNSNYPALVQCLTP